MIRQLLIVSVVLAFSVGSAVAQDERTSIRIEAEIITGLEGGSSPGTIPGTPGTPPIGGVDDDGTDDPDGVQQQPGTSQSVGVEEVAARLMTSAQTGELSMTDTSMVAALSASRSNRQDLDALVTITVIDAGGNVRTSTMRNANLNADMIAPSVGLITIGQQGVLTAASSQQRGASGEMMRRSSGITYFYVQVCSCGL